MRTYIEAYYDDRTPILGNCDGQAVIRARSYKRTKAYKHAVENLRRGKHPKVAYYKVVTENGRELEVINR